MIEAPYSVLLSVIFVATAVICVLHLAQARGAVSAADPHHAAHQGPVATAVHVNHLIMSLAMLLMVWRPVGQVGTWVQVIIFSVFGVLMLAGLPSVHGWIERVGVLTHLVLNAAMVWMLLAMPLLMGHSMEMSSDEHAAHHGGGSMGSMPMQMTPTPAWASTVNWVAVGLSFVVAVWWLVRLLRERGHRVHAACHLLMAAGMALMLALM
ncbi:DUF5134 domain-containing protein [Brachybacterium halotolerans subsp. kimchii]|uniref:DUF5134 domain-containing protein n=1 Tax=Brachybacterium halotolerans TaxID=2795215 RepID=UPI001E4F6DF3|nr:DUF5134 domain-containing protein [Brachybacterium halotolerans]UEJ82794.1 DUF5134 domain-containing protein [Brachybacterium halotolerans subsp. kimchii]